LKDRESESLRRGKKMLGALKSGSAHIALAVWYNPLAGTRVLSGYLLYSCNGLTAFSQFPKGETLLNKRKREVQPERSSVARPWWGVSPGK
jgi:hypothetical protein